MRSQTVVTHLLMYIHVTSVYLSTRAVIANTINLRGIEFITSKGLEVELLVTDRHGQVSKWVKENMKDTLHKYDIWHVAKGECVCFYFFKYCQ